MRLRSIVLPVALVLTLACVANAQPATVATPLARVEVGAAIGWLNFDSGADQRYNDWSNHNFYNGGSVAWYWSDATKTDVEIGASPRSDFGAYSPILIDGRQLSVQSTYHFRSQRLAIGQQYLFNRNGWVQPFVGAGLDVTWRQTERDDAAIPVYDSTTQQYRVVREAVVYPVDREVLTRPFGTVGFKAYVTPRAFFRTDMKLVFHSGVDEVLLRFGFGVDF